LEAVRGQKGFSAEQFKQVQTDFVTWADARFKQGRDAKQMNLELKTAGLFAPEIESSPDDVDIYYSFAGYVDEVRISPLPAGVVLLSLGIGMTCGYDETVVMYESRSTQVAVYDHKKSLSGPSEFEAFEVGKPDAQGRRIVAAGARTHWCSSRFVGVTLRIDEISSGAVSTLLDREVGGSASDRDFVVRADIEQNKVTFEYIEPDNRTFTRLATETYEIRDGKATRLR
jgi:hypothetical protein